MRDEGTIKNFEKIIENTKTIEDLLKLISEKKFTPLQQGKIIRNIEIKKIYENGMVYKYTPSTLLSPNEQISYQITKQGYDPLIVYEENLNNNAIKEYLGIKDVKFD